MSLCDTPRFAVGPEAERTATVRYFARMFVAGVNAPSPLVTVVLRKAYGLGAMATAGGSRPTKLEEGELTAKYSDHMHTAAVSTSITIRNVPDDVRDELASRAARSGRSLQEHLRSELIELARRPSSADLLTRVRRRKEATGSQLPAASILADRDADRP